MPDHPDLQNEREYRQQGLGSGVLVDADGIILTANHVVQDAENIKVLMLDDREFEAARVPAGD